MAQLHGTTMKISQKMNVNYIFQLLTLKTFKECKIQKNSCQNFLSDFLNFPSKQNVICSSVDCHVVNNYMATLCTDMH